MNVPKTFIAALCRKYGAQLIGLPTPVEGPRLLWAIAGNESSFGANSNPRHEAAYCTGGKMHSETLSAAWGCLAHMSYGPWQIMFVNATPGISPLQMAYDAELTARMVARFIQTYVLAKAKSLAEIAEVYNAGHVTKDPAYVEKLTANYAVALVEFA